MLKNLKKIFSKIVEFFSLRLNISKKLGNIGVTINTILILFVSFFSSIHIYYDGFKRVYRDLNIYICFVERIRVKVRVIVEKLKIGYTYLTLKYKIIFFRFKYFFFRKPQYLYYFFLIFFMFFFKIYISDFSSAETETEVENLNEKPKEEKESNIIDLEKEKKFEKIKTIIFYSVIIIVVGYLLKYNYDLFYQVTELKKDISQLSVSNNNLIEKVSKLSNVNDDIIVLENSNEQIIKTIHMLLDSTSKHTNELNKHTIELNKHTIELINQNNDLNINNESLRGVVQSLIKHSQVLKDLTSKK